MGPAPLPRPRIKHSSRRIKGSKAIRRQRKGTLYGIRSNAVHQCDGYKKGAEFRAEMQSGKFLSGRRTEKYRQCVRRLATIRLCRISIRLLAVRSQRPGTKACRRQAQPARSKVPAKENATC